MMDAFHVVIPARFNSSRLPGKPLLEFQGASLIEHVYRRALAANPQSILIATDDERIATVAEGFGATVCMTSTEHNSGTDRIAEAAAMQAWDGDAIIVNLQGDEPKMPSANIQQVAQLLQDMPDAKIATLCEPITELRDYQDPNVVKVTKTDQGLALYFSRSSLPHMAEDQLADLAKLAVYRHVGLYAYRADYLQSFVKKPVSFLENSERLEQLRALQAGDAIAIAVAQKDSGHGIDTAEDFQRLSADD
jgi:3-deoxy-manno-octulosonate cytidylyltransferase (CMP-KDO synthetase)